jgi:hypothetical protein
MEVVIAAIRVGVWCLVFGQKNSPSSFDENAQSADSLPSESKGNILRKLLPIEKTPLGHKLTCDPAMFRVVTVA